MDPNLKNIHGLYRHACPNCHGVIDDIRLSFKAPCTKDLSDDVFAKIIKEVDIRDYYKLIRAYASNVKEVKYLKNILEIEEKVKELEEFFSKATNGSRFWSAQRTWARRVLKGKSFSVIAPTGMGKTTFGLVTALYFAIKNRGNNSKIYLVFPTTPLLKQAYEKLLNYVDRLSVSVRILAFHGRMSKKEREVVLKSIDEGEFDILLTTSMFLHRYHELLKKHKYSFIMVDDVDAILRSGKSIRLLLEILGFKPEEIDAALQLIKLRAQLATRMNEDEKKKIEREVNKLERIVENARNRVKTVVVVSSATGRPRGIYPKLFRVLLGFEAGSRGEAIRNIVDTYMIPYKDHLQQLLEIVRRLGSGGLVYVPVDKGIEYAEEIADYLRSNGVRAEAFHSKKNIAILEGFMHGDIDVLVGVATYYGVMVRGLDLPERVRYAIFVGVPRHKFSTRLEKPRPGDILRVLSILRDVAEGDEKKRIELMIGRLSSRLRRLTQAAVAKLGEELRKAISGEPYEKSPLLEMLIDAWKQARELLARKDIQERLKQSGDIALVEENGSTYLLIPDVATYIQASGRTSRLYPGGITKGLSIILVDDIRLLNGLIKRMRWLFEDLEFKPFDQIDLKKILEEIDKDRERVRKILSGEIAVDKTVEISKSALLIVESPNKARTIANFFGKPSVRIIGDGIKVYDVTTGDYVLSIVASIGHVYDLVVDEGIDGVVIIDGRFVPVYTDIKKCNDCGHQFTDDPVDEEDLKCPRCGSKNITRKLQVIRALQELASEVDLVFIGTDPDTEGEKIGWDLKVLLEPYTREIKRIEFHEITRRAILNAIRNPRDFDMRLVEAQIIRRVEDRWLGFSLSRKLWYDLWPYYCAKYLVEKKKVNIDCCREINRNLSAGRVQTPVLGYVILRAEQSKRPRDFGLLKYEAVVADGLFTIELTQEVIDSLNIKKPKELVGRNVVVREVKSVEEEVNPLPPFTTDTLLAEASLRLGLSSTRAMQIAQELFELGFITYHRTDSTRVSDTGINVAKQWLQEKYGEEYTKVFKPRTWGVGGAHEAIRPTRPIDADRLRELVREGIIQPVRPLTKYHYLLYDLIFRRFIASQMIPSIIVKQVLEVSLENYKTVIERPIAIKRYGFLEIYPIIEPQPPIKPGTYPITSAVERKPPLARFHDVIKWMKEQGIGRPSTYAKIIQTLIDRKYVTVTKRQKALLPMPRAYYVYNFLTKYFKDVVSVETTRRLEELMKLVEEGKYDYQEILRQIYNEVVNKVINVKSDNERKMVCPM
ncbi:MAG: reverse gyrase [Thermoprotei archaeon]|nr:MAG: reverse gyrase [Thermoprotei archaeon]